MTRSVLIQIVILMLVPLLFSCTSVAPEVEGEKSIELTQKEQDDVNDKLFSAAAKGDLKAIKNALREGAELNSTNMYSEHALFIATSNSNEAAVKYLLSRGADVDLSEYTGLTSIARAALDCNDKIITLLAEGGADVNKAVLPKFEGGGLTPLIAVGRSCSLSTVKILTSYNADLAATNVGGETALLAALNYANTPVALFLVREGSPLEKKRVLDGRDALTISARFGLGSLVKEILQRGALVDVRDEKGLTPLIHATKNEHLSTVLQLLSFDAGINAVTDEKRSALMYAIVTGNKGLIRVLLENGAEPDMVDLNDATAMIYALIRGDTESAEILIEFGSDVNWLGSMNQNALKTAALHGNTEAVAMLISVGAKLDIINENGMSALVIASVKGHTEVARLLIKAGADVAVRTNDGFSALDIAEGVKNEELIKLLKEAGAKN